MGKANKANAAEKEARTNKIYDMLVSGMNRAAILQYVSSKTDWKLTPRMVDNYIAEANALLAAEAEFHRPREMGRAVARMNAIFYASLKVQDYQRAIAAARELHQLLGLYAPIKSELKLTADTEIMLTRLLSELQAQNMDASDLFNSIFAKLEAQKAKNG